MGLQVGVSGVHWVSQSPDEEKKNILIYKENNHLNMCRSPVSNLLGIYCIEVHNQGFCGS